MSFLSIQFATLFGSLLALFLVIRAPFTRKLLVLLASAIFYAWADWRYVFLLASVTVADYLIGNAMAHERRLRVRRGLLAVSVTLNLGFLFVFKYSYFAAATADRLFGQTAPAWSIALPIGISFYTFETLSYVIDIYRQDVEPARSLLDYAVFVSFFPRLVAGPIMRARQFLPQLASGFRLSLTSFADGAQMFAIGAFKKLVIADNLATFVDRIYADPAIFTPYTVWAAIFSNAIQVYADFSAYTDMATGLACILGIQLPPNFNLPFVAQSITEFWQRWHISFSSWLRDYLYIPLGGNRQGAFNTYRNLILTMLLGGLWHGASWNFVLWGGSQGLLLVTERLFSGGRSIQPAPWDRASAWFRAIACFTTFSVTLVLFRSKDINTTGVVFRKLAFQDTGGISWIYAPALIFVPAFLAGGFAAANLPQRNWRLAWSNPLLPAFLIFIVLSVVLFMPHDFSPFLYYRF